MAFREGWESTNVDTHTYVFVDDVAHQLNPQDGLRMGRNVFEVDGRDGAGNGIVPSRLPGPASGRSNPGGLRHTGCALDSLSVSIVMHPDISLNPEEAFIPFHNRASRGFVRWNTCILMAKKDFRKCQD